METEETITVRRDEAGVNETGGSSACTHTGVDGATEECVETGKKTQLPA